MLIVIFVKKVTFPTVCRDLIPAQPGCLSHLTRGTKTFDDKASGREGGEWNEQHPAPLPRFNSQLEGELENWKRRDQNGSPAQRENVLQKMTLEREL